MKTILIIIVTLLSITSCKKYETPQEGENSFFCKIDGKNYNPNSSGGFEGGDRPLRVSYYDTVEKLSINTKDINNHTYITFQIHPFIGEGIYKLSFLDLENYTFEDLEDKAIIRANISIYNEDGSLNEIKKYVSSDNPADGEIHMTEFSGDVIFKGTFNATLFNINDATDTINISEGHFEINLDTLD